MRWTVRQTATKLTVVLVAWVSGMAWAASPGAASSHASQVSQRLVRATSVVVPLETAVLPVAPWVSAEAQAALQKSDRYDAVPLFDVLDPPGARERRRRLQEAEQVFAAGQKAYDELDTQKSLALFDRSLKAYEQTDLPRTFSALTRAWVMKIASLVANGENKAAELEMDRLIALDPKVVFPPNYFPPDQVKYAEKVRKQVTAGGNVELDVRTQPSGACVYVDGQLRGVSPLSLKNLVPADHYVTVVMDGYVLAQQRARQGVVNVGLRKGESSPAYFDAFDDFQRAPSGPKLEKTARKFAQAAAVDEVVVTLLRGSDAKRKLELWRVASREGQPTPTLTGQVSAQAMSAELGPLYGQLFAAMGAAPPPLSETQGAGGSSEWTRQKTGYVLLGVAGVATIVASIFTAKAVSTQRHFRNLPGTDPSSASLQSAGRTQAVVADLSWVVAILAAVPGVHWSFIAPASEPTKRLQVTGSFLPSAELARAEAQMGRDDG